MTERSVSIWRWRPGNLARNTGYSLLWQLSRTACLAAYLLVLTHALGPASYGLLSSPLTLAVMFGSLAGGGAGLMLLRDGARSPHQLPGAWSRFFSASVFSVPGCFTGYALANTWLVPGLLSPAVWVPIGVAEIALIPLVNAAVLGFQSLERFNWAGVVAIFPALARLGCALLIMGAHADHRLERYAYLHLAGAAAASLAALSLLSLRASLSWRFVRTSRRWWRDCCGFSLMYFVAGATVDLDKSLVLRNADAVTAGLYSVGYRFMSVLTLPVVALMQAMGPRLMRVDTESVRAQFRTITVATMVVFAYGLVGAFVLWWSSGLVFALLGRDYQAIQGVVPLLGLLLIVYSLRMIPCVVLQSADRAFVRAGIEASAVPILYFLSALLVPRLGLRGAVLTAISSELWILTICWFMAAQAMRARRLVP